MDKVDATDHYNLKAPTDLATLLVIILDTNPFSWDTLAETSGFPLHNAISQLLIFANAHLAFSQANKAAVIASHFDRAEFLSPLPNGIDNEAEAELDPAKKQEISQKNARKYRTFRLLEDEVKGSLVKLMKTIKPELLERYQGNSALAGAFSLALTYINRICFGGGGGRQIAVLGGDDKAKPAGVVGKGDDAGRVMHAKILVVSVSADPANQYIPIMNSIFAAQRLKIPIDVCKLLDTTVFLQQAADATGGVYIEPEHPKALLQYLMMGVLPDYLSRQSLILPTKVDVDFRAACFCHKKVLDVGFVCSICLSIFCSPPEEAVCTTCSSKLDVSSLENLGKPAVVVAKKKKKKKAVTSMPISGTTSAADSPAPL